MFFIKSSVKHGLFHSCSSYLCYLHLDRVRGLPPFSRCKICYIFIFYSPINFNVNFSTRLQSIKVFLTFIHALNINMNNCKKRTRWILWGITSNWNLMYIVNHSSSSWQEWWDGHNETYMYANKTDWL